MTYLKDWSMAIKRIPKKPPWLKRPLPNRPEYEQTRKRLSSGNLHTVCQEAHCPNIFECFSHKTATFLILGEYCTRGCTFCAVQKGPKGLPDPGEPQRVAEAAAEMGLRYVVVTSVTRDDLKDGGAGHFAQTISRVRQSIDKARIEVLIPDFQGSKAALQTVLDAAPDVLNHNIETVPRLYPEVRPQADYLRSLALLKYAAGYAADIPTKSGIMLGFGETDEEVERTLSELRASGCRILTLGQYLQPSRHHHPVVRYIPPEAFDHWRQVALDMGFSEVSSGPLVRSSYHAKEIFQRLDG
jgi:lipoic acid synthetase